MGLTDMVFEGSANVFSRSCRHTVSYKLTCLRSQIRKNVRKTQEFLNETKTSGALSNSQGSL